MCHNPMKSIILKSVPQFHKIVIHQVRTKFWKKKKMLRCLAFLIKHCLVNSIQIFLRLNPASVLESHYFNGYFLSLSKEKW